MFFGGDFLGSFLVAVALLGLRHTVTPVRSPDHNPFAETFTAADKEECVSQSHWGSHEQAITEVEAWIHKYRSRREQAALGGLAPLAYRTAMLQQLAA